MGLRLTLVHLRVRKEYGHADIPCMQARMLAYRLMVLGPIIYIGTLVGRAHVQVTSYDFVACSQKQHEAITAYRPYVIDAVIFRKPQSKHVSRERLRMVAQHWVDGRDKGDLSPLLPVHPHDFVREGVKQEIYRSCDAMISHLIAVARFEAEAGDQGQALRDALLALQLGEVLKYSDPYAVAHAGLQQRAALTLINGLVDGLSPFELAECRQTLQALREQQQPLDHLIRWMKQVYNTERVRLGEEVLPIEELDRYFAIERSRPEDGLASLASIPRPKWAANGIVPTMLGELRMASNSQASFLERLYKQIESLVLKDPEHSGFASISP